jgi:hypothetical protein
MCSCSLLAIFQMIVDSPLSLSTPEVGVPLAQRTADAGRENGSATEQSIDRWWAEVVRDILVAANSAGGETNSTGDRRAFARRLLKSEGARWLRKLSRVLESSGDMASAASGEDSSTGRPQPVRIVADPSAPVLQPQDVDRLYPLRQKELVGELNRQFGRRVVNGYDIQAVRRQHRLDERPDFVFYLLGAGRRYSPAAAEWIAERYRHDSEFFHAARTADQAMLRLRRQKPR